MKQLVLRLGRWYSARFPFPKRRQSLPSFKPARPVLIVVEGPHDIEFLRRISATLHRQHPELPDLAQAEVNGHIAFLPAGGGNLWTWSQRLASLASPEFHVYDRELPPVSQQRQQLVDAINARPNCRAVLTHKRALENYLHPLAILRAGGVAVEFSDDDSVPLLVAQAVHRQPGDEADWAELSPRARKRRCERAKRWLNTRAVDCMTAELLQQRDPVGELAGWLRAAGAMLSRAR